MKTPTRTAAEFRRMYSTAEWDARIEPDGSVWLTIPGRPVPKGRPRLGVHGRKAYDNELER